MVESAQAGFPARGNTLYVFSLGQGGLHGGPGMKETQAPGASSKPAA
jgi:hypothetical protein